MSGNGSSSDPIKVLLQVAKVQTLADGGLRFTFDASEGESMVAAQLIECKRFGVLLETELKPKVEDERESGRNHREVYI